MGLLVQKIEYNLKCMKKLSIFLLLGVVLIFLGLYSGITNSLESKCGMRLPHKKQLLINDAVFEVEIAETAETRRCGLSNREYLSENGGMLFMFDGLGIHGIWMKDMRIPIDIIWFDSELRVVDLAVDVKPDSFPSIFEPKTQVLYVLETRAGNALKYEISFLSQAEIVGF